MASAGRGSPKKSALKGNNSTDKQVSDDVPEVVVKPIEPPVKPALRKESIAKKKGRAIWDEDNLKKNEEEKVPRMKIDEPPTPYNPDFNMQDELDEDPEKHMKPTVQVLDPQELAAAALARREEEENEWEKDEEEDEETKARKAAAKKKAAFEAKRRAHYRVPKGKKVGAGNTS